MNHIQHYTCSGNTAAESIISDMLSKITQLVISATKANHIRSLVLLGGYGKGEGGVIHVEGTFKPHNNFDLMLITNHLNDHKRCELNQLLSDKLNKLGKRLGIGVDISVFCEKQIRAMPTRVLWYDMKEGHQTIYGDKTIIPSIQHLRKDIPAWDVRNLMVNRGSLLLINHLCLTAEEPDNEAKFLIIKHTMKAIIGYGDAILYFMGLYHWSYSEKLNRILKQGDISVKFKRIYSDAINFRFSPKYSYYLEKDLKKWQQEVKSQLEEIHLQCESIRLNQPSLNWDNYLSNSLKHSLLEKGYSLKSFIKLLLGLRHYKKGRLPSNLSFKEKLAYRLITDDAILPLIFPFLAFNPSLKNGKLETLEFLTSHFNKKRNESLPNVIREYLKDWGVQFDKNLWSVLRKNQITI